MRSSRISRGLAVLTAAAVLATMSVATVAGPASAAKPKCAGKVATIVGTKKGEIIRGTAKRDIIVARGGNDRIYGRGGNDLICAGGGNDLVVAGGGADRVYGQAGRDRLFGGPGPDWLAGQQANDRIAGGLGVDTCFQGPGTGPVGSCELPRPEPPTLVVAYSDVNRNFIFDPADVMIAKIVDTIEDGVIGPGDTILMGQYPTTPYAITPANIRQTFEDWRVKSHTLNSGDIEGNADQVRVTTTGNTTHEWTRYSGSYAYDQYYEYTAPDSYIYDYAAGAEDDTVNLETGSPSQPVSELYLDGADSGDSPLINVEIYVS